MFIYNSWPYFLRKRLVSSCHHLLKRRSRILKKAFFSTFGSFLGVQKFFSKKVLIMCSSTTHHLLFCENRLFLSCTIFSHGVLEKKFWTRTRYKKIIIINPSLTSLIICISSLRFFCRYAAEKRSGASRRSSSFAKLVYC